MTKEEIQLLLVDLCARLPHGVICHIEIPHRFIGYVEKGDLPLNSISIKDSKCDFITCWGIDIDYVRPYLRPMSSMTKEELKEYYIIAGMGTNPVVWNKPQPDWHFSLNDLDWLYQHHFDVRGLIPMGLAIEAPKDMYK